MLKRLIHNLLPLKLQEGGPVTSKAHTGDYQLMPPFKLGEMYPHDAVPYQPRDGRLHCAYCGSLHPREVVALLKAGATMEVADWKYGWPHKAYLHDPWGKFYTRHLVDATPEEKRAIEQALRLTIDYDPATQRVSWRHHRQGVHQGASDV